MIWVNGTEYLDYDPDRKLSAWLREDLDLTGTKIGCDIGVCGSCTVLVNGEPKRSCRLKLKDVEGADILTIEGVRAPDGGLHPIQQAFLDAGAIQCGFCTPGMIMSVKALLDRDPNPTEEQIRLAIHPNLCRCTGYVRIVEAALAAAQMLKNEAEARA